MTLKRKKRSTKGRKQSLNIHQFIDQSSDGGMRQINQDLMVGKYLEECVIANKSPKAKDGKRLSNQKYNTRSRSFSAQTRKESTHAQQEFSSSSVKELSGLQSPYLFEGSMDMANCLEVGSKSNSRPNNKHKFLPHPPRRNRPVSAPVYRVGIGSWTGFEDLSSSGSYAGSLLSTTSLARHHKHKPMYKRKNTVLCVLAFMNGTRETYARVTAPDIPQLLIECTSRLDLPSAARKLYLRDGTNVVHHKQLVKDCEVFVSMGEAFKDPLLNLKEREKLRKSSYWTLNGVMVPSDDKKSKRISSALSKRMNKRIDIQKRRILAFRNGECSGGIEIIANKFDEFLMDCTSRLGMTTGARYLYDWSGNIIEDLSEVPMLNKVLQPSTGIVLGPVWVSKGEMFSPRGAFNFLSTMILNTKERIIEGKEVLKELEDQLVGEDFSIDMDCEIDEQKIMLEDLEETFEQLRQYSKRIKESFEEEERTISTYKYKHISEIDRNSRLIGSQTLKVRLYANGMNKANPIKTFLDIRQIKKGTTTKIHSVNNYLDMINSLKDLATLFGVYGMKVIVRRTFLIDGSEVNDLDMIGQNEQIWLSLGEAFVPVNYSVLSLNLDKAKVHDLWGWKQIVQRNCWLGGDQNQTNPKLWQIVSCIPPECDTEEMKVVMGQEEKKEYLNQASESRVRDDVVFIQSKQDHSLVLYPEIGLLTKSSNGCEESLSAEHLQQWCILNNGIIANRHFKDLCIGMLDQPVQVTLENKDDSEVLDGAAVGLLHCNLQASTKEHGVQPNCYWEFTTDGYIQSANNPGYVLTAVQDFNLDLNAVKSNEDGIPHQGSQQWEITSSVRNQIVVTEHHSDSGSDIEVIDKTPFSSDTEFEQQKNSENDNPFENIEEKYGGEYINLIALPRFPHKHPFTKNQRWGIKSDKQDESLGDKWVRQNLIWPVDQGGHNVQGLVEGYLLFAAPSLKWKSRKRNDVFNVAMKDQPLKVKVLRNGVADTTRAVPVVINESKNPRINNSFEVKSVFEGASLSSDFVKFLDSCTYALRLPSAARRAFSQDGKELKSLNLQKDDIVYASCGEGWIDPSLSYAEQQKSGMLATLVADVTKIRRFVELRKQTGYVVQVREDTFSFGEAGLCLAVLPDDPVQDTPSLTIPEEDSNQEGENPVVESSQLTSHQRSHAKLDSVEEFVEKDIEAEEIIDLTEHQRKISGSKEIFNFHQWLFSNEFFQLKSNPDLVMAVEECKPNQEVVVAPKNIDSPYQRWICTEDGMVSLKYNSNLVLTVATPPKNDGKIEEYSDGYNGARLIISNRKLLVNGNSNQAFFYDDDSGYLHAFASDDDDKDVTASNKAGVCTFAVFGKTKIYQPGYIWQSSDSQRNINAVHMFCDACGKAIRGKEKLQSLGEMMQFSCAMGEAKEKNIKFVGAFQTLNGKVDLSEGQCANTLSMWQLHLQRLRDKARLRVIASELSMANNPAVRIVAHRNGESSDGGVLIIGRTIPDILDLCTEKLNLQHAARRLYTLDGEMITHMCQLLSPYYPTLLKQQGQSFSANSVAEDGDNCVAEHDENNRMDLRVPILVWVSMGERFIPIDDVEKVEFLNSYEFVERRETFSSLELEKHCLRQAKGRRLSSGGRDLYKQTMEKVYQSHADDENKMEDSIDKMKNQLEEVKLHQEKRSRNLKVAKDSSSRLLNKMSTMKLYQLPHAVKLLVFPNGEDPACTQTIIARNMEELLDNASRKLALTSCARRVYTSAGKEIFSFNEISRDQTVCISCGEKFVLHKDRRNQMEMRATWSRANRMGDFEMNLHDVESNQSLVLSQPSKPSHHEITLHEIDDGAKTTDTILTRRPKLLQRNSKT